MIKSISHSQQQILSWIQHLYCPEGIDLDPTYGNGGFYKKDIQQGLPGFGLMEDVRRPRLYFDRYRDGVWKADARFLPVKTGSIKSVIIDPPFLAGGGRDGLMVAKYGNLNTGPDGQRYDAAATWELYKDIMTECERVLSPYGHLIVKCQDLLYGRTQYMTHIEVVNFAIDMGLYPKDIFILLARSRPKSWNHQTQHHARKWHSYFLVFGKQNRNVGYSRDPRRKEEPCD